MLGSVQPFHHPASHMSQPPGQLMSLHSRAHRSPDDQSNLRPRGLVFVAGPCVDDEIWLHGATPVLHRDIEIGRPRHAVPRGKHRCDTEIRIKQSASGALCDAGWTRPPAPLGCASAAESRARGLGAGYSAGRSACPLPRLSPCYIWHRGPARFLYRWNTRALTKPQQTQCLAGNRRGPRAFCADRSRIADFRATRRGYAAAFARSNLAASATGLTPIFNWRHTCHRGPRAIP